jgi:hypothetical protein
MLRTATLLPGCAQPCSTTLLLTTTSLEVVAAPYSDSQRVNPE